MTPDLIHRFLYAARVFVLYRSGSTVGDQLCMTAVVRELATTHNRRVVAISDHPELFQHNPHVWLNLGIGGWPRVLKDRLLSLLRFLEGGPVECFLDRQTDYLAFARAAPAGIHIAHIHSRHFVRRLSLTDVRPEMFLSDRERRRFESRFSLPPNFVVVQSEGKTGYTPNKEWGSERFQAVVKAMPEVAWVQVGLPGDVKLEGALDLRGRTPSLRGLAYVIERSRGVLCLEGLLNHMAAALGRSAFVVCSGFIPVSFIRYPTTVAIEREPQVPCAPCGLLTPCPVPGKPCTNDIPPERVVATIREWMGKQVKRET